jgi:hypothetical protein
VSLRPTPVLAVASFGCCLGGAFTSSATMMQVLSVAALVLAALAIGLYFAEIKSVDPYREDRNPPD